MYQCSTDYSCTLDGLSSRHQILSRKFNVHSFRGTINSRALGGLQLTHFSSSPVNFWKWPSHAVLSEHHSIVITQLRGAQRYLQTGVKVLLEPGDSTLIDSARPWSSQCETDCTRAYLRVPQWLMQDRLQISNLPVAP